MAREPAAGLARSLGEARAARLEAVLLAHAARWAAAAAPEHAMVAAPRPESVAALVPDGVELVEAAGPGAAALAAFERFGGPLLLATPDAPRLSAVHAAAVRADLASGAELAFGPGMEGGWYLAGLASPHPEVLEAEWADPTVAGGLVEIARRTGLDVGMLRMERLLRTPKDAEAFRVDPLTPPEVRSLLG